MVATATNLVQTNVPANDTVTLLRQEVAKSPALRDVCHVFALRERSRSQVTIQSLAATMKKEGFDYDRAAYVGVLRSLAKCKIGILKLSRNNRVQALVGINSTLQSIGMAGIDKRNTINPADLRPRYTKVNAEKTVKHEVRDEMMATVNIKYPAKLSVDFGKGEISTFDLPGGINAKQLGELLTKMFAK